MSSVLDKCASGRLPIANPPSLSVDVLSYLVVLRESQKLVGNPAKPFFV